MRRRLAVTWTVALLFAAGPSRAAELRFSRHVVAVFSRLGCNAGNCHGAVKGQNGFRLSLFAADPALDHERLVREANGRRVNVLDPDASLLLLKATGRVPHQGGRLMDPADPEYRGAARLDHRRRGARSASRVARRRPSGHARGASHQAG